MALTRPTFNVNNIQGLADITKDQATAVKILFDKAGADTKAYLVTQCNELDVVDATNVKLTGAQTIAGIKTFSSCPIIPTPTTDFQASTKKYVVDTVATQKTYSDTTFATKTELQDVVVGGIADGTITPAKLSFDPATQVELDEHKAESATETAKGHVELATAAETTAGTDSTRGVHPAGLKVELNKKINNSLATTINDFIVASGVGVFVKRSLAEVKAILGLGSAAYTATTDYVPSSHLNEKAAHAELTNRTITVGVGKDFTGIQAAINSIKKRVDASITLTIDAGTYDESVTIDGFVGSGRVILNGGTSIADSANYLVRSISSGRSSLTVEINGIRGTSIADYVASFQATYGSVMQLVNCSSTVSATGNPSRGAVADYGGYMDIATCAFSNKGTSILAQRGAVIHSKNNSGSGNVIGLTAMDAATIGKNGSQPSGTTAETTGGGGVIR